MSNNTNKLLGSIFKPPINGVIPINVTDTHYIAPDKTEWLKTGTTLQDTNGDYPDATLSSGDNGYFIGLENESEKYGIPEYVRIK